MVGEAAEVVVVGAAVGQEAGEVGLVVVMVDLATAGAVVGMVARPSRRAVDTEVATEDAHEASSRTELSKMRADQHRARARQECNLQTKHYTWLYWLQGKERGSKTVRFGDLILLWLLLRRV